MVTSVVEVGAKPPHQFDPSLQSVLVAPVHEPLPDPTVTVTEVRVALTQFEDVIASA
jgi:hypothetical protein